MFTKESIDFFGALSGINSSILFQYPRTVINQAGSIVADVDMTKLTESFEDFGIYDFNALKAATSLVENFEVLNEEHSLIIKNSKTSVEFFKSSKELIKTPVPEGALEKLYSAEELYSFDISLGDIGALKKAINLFNDFGLKIVFNSNEIVVKAQNESSNSFKTSIDSSSQSDISFEVSTDIFAKLPTSNYKVTVRKISETQVVIVFENSDIDYLKICMAGMIK